MTRWLLDTSALGQRGHPDVQARLARCLEEGGVVCDMVVAESLVRAVSPDDFVARRRFFDTVEVLPVDAAVWEGVCHLADLLADAGSMVATGDVIIAACARLHALTIVHYDSDYEVLGAACGISHDWVVTRGTL